MLKRVTVCTASKINRIKYNLHSSVKFVRTIYNIGFYDCTMYVCEVVNANDIPSLAEMNTIGIYKELWHRDVCRLMARYTH